MNDQQSATSTPQVAIEDVWTSTSARDEHAEIPIDNETAREALCSAPDQGKAGKHSAQSAKG